MTPKSDTKPTHTFHNRDRRWPATIISGQLWLRGDSGAWFQWGGPVRRWQKEGMLQILEGNQ